MALSVSIAMTTYNGARFVTEQLASFAGQTMPPAEVIVVDDGSTDSTRAIVAAYAAKSPFPIRLHTYEKYLGVKAKFQIAAELSQSDIIAFSDQDDVWLPNKLALCLEKFAEPDTLLVYHNATVTDAALKPIGTMDFQGAPQAINPPDTLDPWLFANGFAQLMRREMLKYSKYWTQSADFNLPQEPEAHDEWFFFLASCLGNIAYINQPLALYRQHGANMYGWTKPMKRSLKSAYYNLLMTGLDGLHGREVAAGRRAAILEQLQRELIDPTQRCRALEAAVGYRRLETSYRLRQNMYVTPDILTRLSRLGSLIRQGAYQSRQKWGVGPRAIVRDIVRGIIIPVRKAPAAQAANAP